jgi:hypothetical protein
MQRKLGICCCDATIIQGKVNYNIKIAIRFFENLKQFKYLGMSVTNQYLIEETEFW